MLDHVDEMKPAMKPANLLGITVDHKAFIESKVVHNLLVAKEYIH